MKCGPRVRELGGAIAAALPRQITQDVLKLNLVRGDVFTIMWWARAMHKAAKELVAMRTFLDQRDATTLSADKDFLRAGRNSPRRLPGSSRRLTHGSTIHGMSSRWTRRRLARARSKA